MLVPLWQFTDPCTSHHRNHNHQSRITPLMDKTLWKHPEKQFLPRNKQAALITIKAKPIFLPPEEIPAPVMAETFLQKVARENAERAIRVQAIVAENQQAERTQKHWEDMCRERQRILKVIRTTARECEQRGKSVPPHIEELRKKLADFPKKKKNANLV